MVAALASWLDAQAHQGTWLVRIEDVDGARCVQGVDELILSQLAACQLIPDELAPHQSTRGDAYAAALQRLTSRGAVFRCNCSRKQIASHWEQRGRIRQRHDEWPYPGTCRDRLDLDGAAGCALRLRCGTDASPLVVDWHDRRLGDQQQDVTRSVGDFVLRRADGSWAYQLAVVVDDAAQRITDVVRGEDLADNTARQIHLQTLLGVPHPRYLHTPLVRAEDGEKLSKQNGARAIDPSAPLQVLRAAGTVLGLAHDASSVADWLAEATRRWAESHGLESPFGAKPIRCEPMQSTKGTS